MEKGVQVQWGATAVLGNTEEGEMTVQTVLTHLSHRNWPHYHSDKNYHPVFHSSQSPSHQDQLFSHCRRSIFLGANLQVNASSPFSSPLLPIFLLGSMASILNQKVTYKISLKKGMEVPAVSPHIQEEQLIGLSDHKTSTEVIFDCTQMSLE